MQQNSDVSNAESLELLLRENANSPACAQGVDELVQHIWVVIIAGVTKIGRLNWSRLRPAVGHLLGTFCAVIKARNNVNDVQHPPPQQQEGVCEGLVLLLAPKFAPQ